MSIHHLEHAEPLAGRRVVSALELLAMVVGAFSVTVLMLHVGALIAIDFTGSEMLGLVWLAILIMGVAIGLLGAVSFAFERRPHAIGILAWLMVVLELGANLALADGEIGRMLSGYPDALMGHFDSESMIAAWRFPLALVVGLLYLAWLVENRAAARKNADG
ncbi:hypothetical protein BH09ACT10_BH09ACT10_09930 [soil metagenome]